jgi:hypothetical protein
MNRTFWLVLAVAAASFAVTGPGMSKAFHVRLLCKSRAALQFVRRPSSATRRAGTAAR